MGVIGKRRTIFGFFFEKEAPLSKPYNLLSDGDKQEEKLYREFLQKREEELQ